MFDTLVHSTQNTSTSTVSQSHFNLMYVSTIRLYSAIHIGTRWKIWDKRRTKNRHYEN